jgi:predicted CopG family antitoxin
MKTIIIQNDVHMALTLRKLHTGERTLGDVIKKLLEPTQENKKK